MVGVLVLALSTLGAADAPVADIAEIIMDAQATNAALVASGSAKFQSRLEMEGRRAVEARGTFAWRGQDGLWVFKFSDPDGVFSRKEDYIEPVDDAPTEYMLVNEDRLRTYSSKKNALFINRIVKRSQTTPGFRLFDLFPDSLWYRCCPPHQTEGRPWKDMFGPNSPASRPNSAHEISATGPRTYRFTRRDPDVGVMETDVSLQLAGHVTATKYTPSSPRVEATRVEYVWERLPGGAVVLKSCEATRARPGDPSSVAVRFAVELEILKVGKAAVARSTFLPSEFEKLLPENTKVVDHVANRSYPLHPDSGPPPDRLKDLSEELKDGGLLKKDGGRP